MRRISIRSLMALVLVFAVGLAALRNANELWAATLLLAALAALGVAVLGAALMRGWERAWWLGFAVFGGGYLVVALSPLRVQLSTTHLLEYVHAKAASFQVVNLEVSRFDRDSVLYRVVFSNGVSIRKVADSVANSTPTSDLLATMAPANRWRAALPGAANHHEFLRVGHSLFALLVGMAGGMVATWFHARRLRGDRPGAFGVGSG